MSTEFVSGYSLAGKYAPIVQAVLSCLHPTATKILLWSAEENREVRDTLKVTGQPLTHKERSEIAQRIWYAELRRSVTKRWGYRVLPVNHRTNAGAFDLLVALDASEDEVYEALWSLWDLAKHESGLTSAELRPVVERASADAQPYVMVIPAMTKEDLLSFVQGWALGTVYTMESVGDSASMVFMPLLFGCLDLPKEVPNPLDQWCADPGKMPPQPHRPAPLARPTKPKRRPAPAKPAALSLAPALAAQLDDLSWTDPDAAEEQMAQAMTELKARTGHIEAKWLAEMAAWEDDLVYKAELAQWRQALADNKDRNAAALVEYKTITIPAWERQKAQWLRDSTVHRLAAAAFTATRLADLGTVWADSRLDKPLPRGVNGYPMFMSCHLMSKADLTRVNKLMELEAKQRADQKAALEQAVAEILSPG